MDIICDTNIWYNIGMGNIDLSKLSSDDKLIGNYNNIDELAHTTQIISFPDVTRKAIQSLYNSAHKIILDPPFIHLIKLHNPDFKIDMQDHIEPMVEFTKAISQGSNIDSSKIDEFKTYNEERKKILQEAANTLNNEADTIKKAIKNKNFKNKEDRMPSVRELISTYASEQRGGQHLPSDYDWSKIELLENVILEFFAGLEKGAYRTTANDWYDFFQLAYVQPGQKIWTMESKWNNMIDAAGMNKYRYQ
ncbi:MAG: hypothetical protein JNJ40_09120 [Bacteroidia bacterium]|nr:hypothetical protein [Bacteroidia bacterium]